MVAFVFLGGYMTLPVLLMYIFEQEAHLLNLLDDL
jgi:hypothetical protein